MKYYRRLRNGTYLEDHGEPIVHPSLPSVLFFIGHPVPFDAAGPCEYTADDYDPTDPLSVASRQDYCLSHYVVTEGSTGMMFTDIPLDSVEECQRWIEHLIDDPGTREIRKQIRFMGNKYGRPPFNMRPED